MTRRKPLTRSQLATLILSQEGRCKACGERLDFSRPKQVVDEHLCPLAEGGTNETENRALYCKPCATAKTIKEAPARAKSKRIAEGRTQADRRKQRGPTIKGRGFSKEYRKRMDGTVLKVSHD